MSVLDAAIALACRVHAGQLDKSGKPYILHPLRLMLQVEDLNSQLAAVLHDVIEDGNILLDDLREIGLPETVVEAIGCLTKRPGETYEAYIERIGEVELARRVKLRDLRDNMDTTRLAALSPTDLERLAKYHRALQHLSGLEHASNQAKRSMKGAERAAPAGVTGGQGQG